MMKYRGLYQETIRKWGEEAQYDQAIEECAELITSIQHFKRGKAGKDAVIHELADVYLMVGQLMFMLGESKLDSEVAKKVEKLEKLLHAEG